MQKITKRYTKVIIKIKKKIVINQLNLTTSLICLLFSFTTGYALSNVLSFVFCISFLALPLTLTLSSQRSLSFRNQSTDT